MRLPEAVRAGVEEVLGGVQAVSAVSGGCVSSTARLETVSGLAFLKFDRSIPAGFFESEAAGLAALAAAGSMLRVPAVLGWRDSEPGGWGWVALEWVEPGRPGPDFWERLGAGLAGVHRAGEGGWGWERDGFIGTLPQANAQAAGWAEFWRDRRLLPQLRLARDAGRLSADSGWDELFLRLPELLAPAEAEGPALLHGDLWSGNVLVGSAGEPVLVDPSVYRGHREVDLAMAELFGGFPSEFHQAYRAAWPLASGYGAARRAAYQLYYLLVHVNLFGGAYAAQTTRALRSVVAA